MLIHYIPTYCGGRFLTGLWNTQGPSLTHGYVWEKCASKWQEASDGSISRSDPCPYLPSTIEEFQQILKKFLYVDQGSNGYQGVVFAVTNREQNEAPRYLVASGFKEAGKFSKTDYGHSCTTWIGDYRKDMYPILSKIPPFKEQVKSEPKFATTMAIPTRAPAPWNTQQVPNTLRNSAQQTLSPSDGRENTIRPRARQ